MYEIQDEISGKNMIIFKKQCNLNIDKFNPSMRYFCFNDAKFFFDMIFPQKVKKLVYLPEDFYFSPNVPLHALDLWLFLEKNEKNLFEYLVGFKDSRSYDSLKIFRAILKNFIKIKKKGIVVNHNFSLENIYIIYNSKKSRQEFKFDVLSIAEKEAISSDFIYFTEFLEGKTGKGKTNVSSQFLKQIHNEDIGKFGFLLFFIYFPRFLKNLELSSQDIMKFLAKTKKTDMKIYDNEII